MPANVINSKRDETKWEKAKAIIKKQYPHIKEGEERFYKLVMTVYKNMKGTAMKKSLPAIPLQKAKMPDRVKPTKEEMAKMLAVRLQREAKSICTDIMASKDPENENRKWLEHQVAILYTDKNGNPDIEKISEAIYNLIVSEWEFSDKMLLACRAVDFTPAYVKDVIKKIVLAAIKEKKINNPELPMLPTVSVSKALKKALTKKRTLKKAETEGKYRLIKTKDLHSGEELTIKVPEVSLQQDDRVGPGKTAKVPMGRSDDSEKVQPYTNLLGKGGKKKVPRGDSDIQIASDGKPSIVGRRVYFSQNKNQPVLSGEVTGHGKHGITIRDKDGKKHQVEHGYYLLHKDGDDDYGGEDFGDASKDPEENEETIDDEIEKAFKVNVDNWEEALEKAVTDAEKDEIEKAYFAQVVLPELIRTITNPYKIAHLRRYC